MGFLDSLSVPTKTASGGGFLGGLSYPTAAQTQNAQNIQKYQAEANVSKAAADRENSVGGFLMNFLKAIPNATGIPQMATGSFKQATDALTTAATGGSTTGGLKEGFDLVTGVGGVALSPFAPIINPVSYLIQKAIDTAAEPLSNTPYIKSVAGNQVVGPRGTYSYVPNDQTTATKILQTANAAGNAAMTLLAAGGVGRGKAAVEDRFNAPVEEPKPAIALPEEARPATPSDTAPSTIRTGIVENTKEPRPLAPPESSSVETARTGTEVSPSVDTTSPMVDVKTTKSASDISQRLVDQGIAALPESEQAAFRTGSYKATADAVANLIDQNERLATDAALGKAPIPTEITHPEILFNTIEAKAIKEGNTKLLYDLSRSPVSKTSEAGATLGSHGFNDNLNSPVTAIREVRQVRASKFEPKVKEVVRKVKQSIRKTHTKETWGDFIKSIEC